jgi:two-component system NtrC family sensor kinase
MENSTAGMVKEYWQRLARSRRRSLALLCIGITAVLFGAAAWYDHEVSVRAAREQVSSAADALAEHARTVLSSAELVLDRVAERIGGASWDSLSASSALHDELARIAQDLPEVESIFVVDPGGHIAASSRAFPMERYDVSMRDYFAVARAGLSSVYVSAPFRGKMSRTVAFTVSKPLSRNGQFDGVVAVTLFPGYFHDFYRSVLKHPDAAAAALVRSDGYVLVRYPEVTQDILRLKPDDPLMQAVASEMPSGTLWATSSISGRDEIADFRRLEHQPLYVVFALDRQAYLTPWYWRVAAWAAFAALAGAAMFLAMDQVTRRLELEKEQLKLLLAEGDRRREAELRLLQSQKFEALGQVTGGVAHDFNNLLAAIMAALKMLRKRASDPKEIELLRLAEEAADKGAKITQQMLAFARRQSVEAEIVDINEAVKGMSELLRHTVGSGVILTYELGTDLPRARIDPIGFEMAILNLAANARDAMPQGGTLIISTAKTAGEGDGAADSILVAVSDNGTGMSEEVRQRALEPFFTTKGPGRGTGLGLASVFGFATQAGGSVTIESSIGKGTTVKIVLPSASQTTGIAA